MQAVPPEVWAGFERRLDEMRAMRDFSECRRLPAGRSLRNRGDLTIAWTVSHEEEAPARAVLQACCLGRGPALVRQGSEVDRERPFVCRGFLLLFASGGLGLRVVSSHAGSNNAGR
jgi:hypothetical protein